MWGVCGAGKAGERKRKKKGGGGNGEGGYGSPFADNYAGWNIKELCGKGNVRAMNR